MNPNLQGDSAPDARFILPEPLRTQTFSVSFFDDDEPPTRQARPRRPSGATAGATTGTRARSAGGGGDDPQQLMVRRAVALGIGALILILLVVGVRGCLNTRANNALRDYNRNVEAIVNDSNDQVSARLFELLAAGGQGTNLTELQQNVNQVRVTAEEDVRRARALDVPGDVEDAQRHLLQTLTFRAQGVERIAEELPNLEGDQSEEAASRIAGQMSAFLASDVIYASRVVPFLQEALAEREISDQPVPSVFLPDTQWLDAAFVRRQLTGRGSGRTSAEPAPGTHGHGLLNVSVGDTQLTPGATNRVPAADNPVFNLTFANQGENDEFDVSARVSIAGGGGDPIEVVKEIDQTATGGEEIELQVPLGETPPVNQPVEVTTEILPVPGEVNTDNNSQTYTVIFSR